MKNEKINSLTILKFFFGFMKKYPGRLIGLLFVVPLANIFLRMLPPLIVADIINKLTTGSYISGDLFGSFGKELLLYGGLTIIGGIILWRVAIYLVWTLQAYVERDLYQALFSKYIELDSNFHANSFGGSLVSRASKLASSYVRIQDTFIFQFYLMLVAYVFVSVIMYTKSPVFVYGMWIFSALFILISLFITRRVRYFSIKEANAQNKVTGYLADAVTNVSAIKSYAKSHFENQRFGSATEDVREKTIKLMWATIWRDIFSSSFTSFVSIFALVIAVYAVVYHGAELSLVFLLFTYTADITERLWEFNTSALRNYNRAIGDATEGVETMMTESAVKDISSPQKLEKNSKNVHFNNVGFSHNDSGDAVLFSNFELSIEPGTKVGLVGHSGSGKTTLVRLLMRYMDVDAGKIQIGNIDIANVTQENLHEHIAYVPQEPMLFHRSLAENIGYGKAHASQEEIVRAAKLAHCHEFIKDLPQGYDTLVGERGVKLSGGQRQRVAIARAIVKESPILILDEATSALDSESEALIQDALWKLMENKTAIVVAHRLSTIQKMDRIVVLDDGRIVEDGTHKELLEKNGVYASLWDHQTGGFLED